MIRRLLLLGCVWLTACASPPVTTPPPDVWHDALFVAPVQRPDATDLLAPTAAMRHYLHERIAPQVRRKGAQMALVDALYTGGELQLEYDARRTRNAGEAFDARMGNCLSLVIMTASFAREMGLQVQFRQVLGAPALEQDGDFTFVVGHVNLVLSSPRLDSRVVAPTGDGLVIDFLPGQDVSHQRVQVVDERRIRAMYMNNRAAEALAAGQVNEAYWWLRGAAAADAGFSNLYNTLGVVYRRQGALAQAEQALRAASRMDPANEHVRGNIGSLQLAQARAADGVPPASGQGQQVRSNRFDRARAALAEGRPEQALLLLNGELGLTPRNAELHHWLAVANARLGNTDRARMHLELAADYSSGTAKQALYAAKLVRLKTELARHRVQ